MSARQSSARLVTIWTCFSQCLLLTSFCNTRTGNMMFNLDSYEFTERKRLFPVGDEKTQTMG